MKISVLMSVYDKEEPKFLSQALESLIAQTLKPDEIVIIKDGKLTKELDEILENYKNNFPDLVRIYELRNHSGLGTALNFGVAKCKYEYIARMDTDDISVPTRFEEQVKILRENPDLDILRRIYR